jgi:hypothetical protein
MHANETKVVGTEMMGMFGNGMGFGSKMVLS